MKIRPWEQLPDVWKSESSFWNWMRGALRRSWSRHPIKLAYIHKYRIRAGIGRGGKEVFALRCCLCNEMHPQSQIEIDHIIPAGSLRSEEDLCGWIKRLLVVSFEDIRPVCIPCHRIHSYAQKQEMTFEQAMVKKKAIDIMKDKESARKILDKHGYLCKNDKQRREAIEKLLCQGVKFD
jgi:hypothetical protein